MNEHSYGIIPVKKTVDGEYLLFLIRQSQGFWCFPKGHSDKGELPKHTAQRELFEETGLSCLEWAKYPPFLEEYSFKRKGVWIDKKVHYFLAKVSGKVFLQSSEVIDGRWLAMDQCKSIITFKEGKAMFEKIYLALQETLKWIK